jgi:hypothetical protein
MADYKRDPIYLHPAFFKNYDGICQAIESALPAGWTAKIVSGHRTPEDQFEIYKEGRDFQNGSWVKVGTTFTNLDGYVKKSYHNRLPSMALDIGLFKPNGEYLKKGPEETTVNAGASAFDFEWGGDWSSPDFPHIQMPIAQLFESLDHDAALQWQKYLYHAGVYQGAFDGYFGTKSQEALKVVVGTKERTIQAMEGPIRSVWPSSFVERIRQHAVHPAHRIASSGR